MADKGDVLVVKRRLGFAARGEPERFVVLQTELLAPIDTVIVAPLDDDLAIYSANPLAVRIPAREAGGRGAGRQVALLAHLSSLILERFEPRVIAQLRRPTLARIDSVLQLLFDLPQQG